MAREPLQLGFRVAGLGLSSKCFVRSPRSTREREREQQKAQCAGVWPYPLPYPAAWAAVSWLVLTAAIKSSTGLPSAYVSNRHNASRSFCVRLYDNVVDFSNINLKSAKFERCGEWVGKEREPSRTAQWWRARNVGKL